MASSAELIGNFRGPALLSYGFRPFFLFGAVGFYYHDFSEVSDEEVVALLAASRAVSSA